MNHEVDATRSSVLVVGTSAAGLATAESLRRLGHRGPLTLLDAEPHPPYDRPPLSKQFLAGQWERERLMLRPEPVLADLGACIRRGERALALDVAARSVRTDRAELQADHIVLATGLRPRTLAGRGGGDDAVHVLRSLEDAARLRDAVGPDSAVVVVGDGVLGSEIAATLSGIVRQVTLVGSARGPMAGSLGALGSALLADMHAAAGVRMVRGARAARVHGAGGPGAGVELEDGRLLPADVVVLAIGSVPCTAWLEGSGLALEDGIVCDPSGRAAEGVWAAGDAARWHHVGLGRDVRLENRAHATEMGLAVARNILGADRPYAPIPSFWTDHYGVRIQVFGALGHDGALEVVDGDAEEGRFVAVSRREGRTTGVLGWAMPKQARLRSREIDAFTPARVPA